MSGLSHVEAFIMSGGTGTRLWPLSRRAMPKQFLDLFGDGSLFQQTVKRLGEVEIGKVSLIGALEHQFIFRDQLAEIGASVNHLVLEPIGRNTAAAAATAALLGYRDDPNGLVLLLPSDHVIRDVSAFGRGLAAGVAAAERGALVTFGIVPDHPATGFGYIEVERTALEGAPAGPLAVARFTEKPDLETARQFLAGGRHFWNSGMFLFSARAMLDAFRRHAPEVLQAVERSLEGGHVESVVELSMAAMRACPNISVDHAIMEHASNIMTVPLEAGWSDLGAWDAVWANGCDRGRQDRNGNVAVGDVMVHEARNSLLYSTGPAIAAVGVEDICVIATHDVVLVLPRKDAQDVGKLVAALQRQGREEVTMHPRCHRPWGWYERLSIDNRFQVKRIMVKPGGKLSLQSHMHRSEHWVVVSGTARVTVGDYVKTITENESAYVPVGAVHRLENPGKIPVHMIEVQSGAYLGEDDIVRYEDIYARVTPEGAEPVKA